MCDRGDDGDDAPTAAVGSTSPLLRSSGTRARKLAPATQPDPTFSLEQVMSLVTSITKQAASSAASSAVTAALNASPAPSRDRGTFYLPPFDPDVRSHDIRDWCANVDQTISTIGISPHEARMKAILQLKGRAKTWADTWSLQSTTWEQVKQDLIQTFGEEFRYADDVQRWRNFTSEQASSYADYATTGWTLFKRVRPEATDAEVIDALITGIYPDFIKCELLRNTPDSLPKLVSVLKTYRKRDRPKTDNSTDKNPPNKKPRPFEIPATATNICFRCRKPGHLMRDCKGNSVASELNPPATSASQVTPDRRSVECKYCHKKGHLEKNCFRKQNDEKSKPQAISVCEQPMLRADITHMSSKHWL
nr:uncharacterized protein LOC126054576 [Helicoverpa armigera]